MRKRRKSFAWVFLVVGLVFVCITVAAILIFASSRGLLSTEWSNRIANWLAQGQMLVPDSWLRFFAWIGGIGLSALTASTTLLASWHFAEMNLPQRIEDFKKAHGRDQLLRQPRLLALARSGRGLGRVSPDIETSRLMLLRKWLSGWSEREQARVLSASTKLLSKQVSALASAATVAQREQITAHLIRGYQFSKNDDEEYAFEQFDAATRVRADDTLSRDIAAGCARRLNKQKREQELLVELREAARQSQSTIIEARALRRQAELLDKRANETDWRAARDMLDVARRLLEPLVADVEAKRELGRVLTLFCEVQISRLRVGRLGGAEGPLVRMKRHMAGAPTTHRIEESAGEAYGEERAARVEKRLEELVGDEDTRDGD
jgi:hypothetical protein